MTTEHQQDTSGFDIQKIDAQLQKWREKLIDLTKSNPLLRINHSRVSKLQAIEPDLENLFIALVRDGKTLKMPLVKRKVKKKRRITKDEQQAILPEDATEEEPEFTLCQDPIFSDTLSVTFSCKYNFLKAVGDIVKAE
jgi:hypothetical protein